jgi:hypothetical protein
MAVEFIKPPPARPDPFASWTSGALEGLAGVEHWLVAAAVVAVSLIAFRALSRPIASGAAPPPDARRATDGDAVTKSGAGFRRRGGRASDPMARKFGGPSESVASRRAGRSASALPWTRRGCRWRVDKRRNPAVSLRRWVCADCGVEAYSADGKAPKECKRALRDARL